MLGEKIKYTPCGNHIIGKSEYLFVKFLKPINISIFLFIDKRFSTLIIL